MWKRIFQAIEIQFCTTDLCAVILSFKRAAWPSLLSLIFWMSLWIMWFWGFLFYDRWLSICSWKQAIWEVYPTGFMSRYGNEWENWWFMIVCGLWLATTSHKKAKQFTVHFSSLCLHLPYVLLLPLPHLQAHAQRQWAGSWQGSWMLPQILHLPNSWMVGTSSETVA